jgi:HlyD family secretion protein
LFTVALDMRAKMHVVAAVAEADIGRLRLSVERRAQGDKNHVSFTVDAWPDLFEGKVFQVRNSSTTTQNVVTYPVIVATANSESKLLPGMTAKLSFQVDEKQNVLRVPNAALKFRPPPERVRPDYRLALEGEGGSAHDAVKTQRSSGERAKARGDRTGHVWVEDGDYLIPLKVVTGISDDNDTQLVSGDLAEGQQLVTGVS